MWVTFPWRPSRSVVLGALVLTCITMLVVAVSALLPSGAPREIVRVLFGLFVIVMIIRAINSRVGRLEDEGWAQDGSGDEGDR